MASSQLCCSCYVLLQDSEAAIPYIVRTHLNEPEASIFTAEAETKRDAIGKVEGFRAQDLLVRIIDSDGKPVDKTEDE